MEGQRSPVDNATSASENQENAGIKLSRRSVEREFCHDKSDISVRNTLLESASASPNRKFLCRKISNDLPPFAESSVNGDHSNMVVTAEMIRKEEKLKAIISSEETKFLQQQEKEKEKLLASKSLRAERYERLKMLLEKSNKYANHLIDRIHQQKDELDCQASHVTAKSKKTRKRKKPSNLPVNYRQFISAKIEPASKKMKSEFCSADGHPMLFTGGQLWGYQIEGYKWLNTLYLNGVNGILADEMGLGKTVQVIAAIARCIEVGVQGPFLIVAPLSTITNWINEFKRFTPLIPVVLYHGSKGERQELRNRLTEIVSFEGCSSKPVFVTSYEMAMNDCGHLRGIKWSYLVVDEGHRIKNQKCRLVRELKRYNASDRILLTGTPLQNSLAELWSLLNFLLPEIFDDLASFESWFDAGYMEQSGSAEEIVRQEQESSILAMLQEIIRPFMLRRLKTDVSLDIPPKEELIVYASMSLVQVDLYMKAVTNTLGRYVDKKQGKIRKEFDGLELPVNNKGRAMRKSKHIDYEQLFASSSDESDDDEDEEKTQQRLKNYSGSMNQKKSCCDSRKEAPCEGSVFNVKLTNIMMILRKCCNHPYLLEYPLTDDGQFRVDEELVMASGKLQVLDLFLQKLQQRDHKVLIFSQMTKMLDILEDFCHLRGYCFSRLDGSMNLLVRQEQIDSFNKGSDTFIFLLSTRAGGLGLNLTAADTVIIYDSDWNPQSDLQAQDRCHRLGQSKPVMIYRLVAANTVDEKIVIRAAAKRKLEKLIITKGQYRGLKSVSRLKSSSDVQPMNAEELLSLLQEDDAQSVKSKVLQLPTDQQLEDMLDRSRLLHQWKVAEQGKGADVLEPRSDLVGVYAAVPQQNSSLI